MLIMELRKIHKTKLKQEIQMNKIKKPRTEIKEALSTEQKCAIFDLENEIKFLMMAQQVQHTLNQINRQVLLGDK